MPCEDPASVAVRYQSLIDDQIAVTLNLRADRREKIGGSLLDRYERVIELLRVRCRGEGGYLPRLHPPPATLRTVPDDRLRSDRGLDSALLPGSRLIRNRVRCSLRVLLARERGEVVAEWNDESDLTLRRHQGIMCRRCGLRGGIQVESMIGSQLAKSGKGYQES